MLFHLLISFLNFFIRVKSQQNYPQYVQYQGNTQPQYQIVQPSGPQQPQAPRQPIQQIYIPKSIEKGIQSVIPEFGNRGVLGWAPDPVVPPIANTTRDVGPKQTKKNNDYECLSCAESCELKEKPRCPESAGWHQFRDSCYYFEKLHQSTWRKARGFCAGLTDLTGQQRAHLVIINDIMENDFLHKRGWDLWEESFPTSFWTDLVHKGMHFGESSSSKNVSSNLRNWEWFYYYSGAKSSAFRAYPDIFGKGTGECMTIQYVTREIMVPEQKRVPVEESRSRRRRKNRKRKFQNITVQKPKTVMDMIWSGYSCGSLKPPLCEIDLKGNVFN